MGWDHNGRYYTRSRRENGRVVRDYIGGGKIGELSAQFEALKREEREAERAIARTEREEIDELDSPLAELDELADLVMKAALLAAGYRQHNRGNWRKRRGNHNEDD